MVYTLILSIFYVLMPVSIVLAFLWAPPAEILGETSRILYFHVPVAWVTVLAFVMSGVSSLLYLWDRNNRFFALELKAYHAARLGLVFCVITVITGSMWAKASWGSYWNWDPRQTSIMVLFLIYIAYFSLYSAMRDNSRRDVLASAYLVFAMVSVPFLVFVIPRIYPSLHPDPIINAQRKINMDPSMQITLMFSMISFTLFFLYLYTLQLRAAILQRKIEERYYEKL